MLNREIPYRPRLEGNFRIRFYNAVSEICETTPITRIEAIVANELDWVENKCAYNPEQRKKYRSVWLLFRDLVRSSWNACYREGVLYMSLPTLTNSQMNEGSTPEIKSLMRSWMSESRHERLISYTNFIGRMERNNPQNHNISELIADGNELASRLQAVKAGSLYLHDAVKPYLQLVTENERDHFTGIKISEIWRYFRLTWSTPAETTPGRTMQYLIRDAANPMHAVMGIASLENCAVQITCRDDYIGWNQKAYIERLLSLNSQEVKAELKILLGYIEDGINGIDYHELCTQRSVEVPNGEDIQRLLDSAMSAEQRRQQSLKESSAIGYDEENKSDLGSISRETEEALYSRKRADQLARLLIAKKAMTEVCEAPNFEEIWVDFCKGEAGNSAIRTALVAQKTKHIGSSLMELNVCGAIPPYNEILGGKLVALLATSPQVIHDYKVRYTNKPSEIATRLKGEPVCRPADLVYVGTTSLYYVGSSQYNRLKIPGKVFDSNFDVVWKQLGMTIGFGTMHISKATTLSLAEATSDGFNRINHVFGEGASPKMRLLTMSIRELLEATNEDSKDFSKHAMSRIVYGACLAKNTFDYLLGKDNKPEYYTDMDNYQEGTQRIIDYWINRWLASRLKYDPIYERIRNFNKADLLVGNQIQEKDEWKFKPLKEVEPMPEPTESSIKDLDFVRDFYRGMSAYADHVEDGLLAKIHLETRLDDAIANAVKTGKDIVLTGNAGDGKTHIIRILKKRLMMANDSIQIELDASTLSDEKIFQKWQQAKEDYKPFVIAINAAVLHSVYKKHPDFKPLQEAYYQMCNSVVFHEEPVREAEVIVFDLSKRETLTQDTLKRAIDKLTDSRLYTICQSCAIRDGCSVGRNCELLKDNLFQERIYNVFQRASLQGYHATLRELQGFIAYLIFGDRDCSKINRTMGRSEYDIVNLIYSGSGNIFRTLKKAFDPVNISHPVWDERLLVNDIADDSWVDGYSVAAEAIAFDNSELFLLRKRQFFFFNKNGNELLNISDDVATRFQEFLKEPDKKIIKELIRRLNRFFGAEHPTNSELQVWTGHRFDNEPRKVLVSVGSLKASAFRIGHPTLSMLMRAGLEMTANYVRLEKKDSPDVFLKIDFDMYLLLDEAERGVPVLFTESDLVKKVWRFLEQLQSYDVDDMDDNLEVSIMDIQNKKKIIVGIDLEEKKYTSIESVKN